MDELVSKFGVERGLQIDLEWASDPASGSAASATRGRAFVSIAGVPVWHDRQRGGGLEWTWVELLEHLSNAWPFLLSENGLPFGLRPAEPSVMWAQAKDRWERYPSTRYEPEQDEFESFAEVHDLSRSFKGMVAPPLWFVREGECCWLCSDRVVALRPFDEAVAALSEVGDVIATRIDGLDERSAHDVRDWRQRNDLNLVEQVSIATGLEPDRLAIIHADDPAEAVWDVNEGPFEMNELLAAARMARQLPVSDIDSILSLVRATDLRQAEVPTALIEGAGAVLQEYSSERPYDQGYAVAGWLRQQKGVVKPSGRAEPSLLLSDWNVPVVEVEVSSLELNALGVWGPQHGPTIFLNKHGRNNQSRGGERATVAHELGHLLMDTDGLLPLVEVLGGATSPLAEQRAAAFAAELLLPRDAAGRVMTERTGPAKALRSLQLVYGVSSEVVAWQARNSGFSLPDDVESFLRSKVSNPERF